MVSRGRLIWLLDLSAGQFIISYRIVHTLSAAECCRCLLSEYRDLFNTFDREHKGSVSVADLLAVSQQLGLPSNQVDLDQLLTHSNVKGTVPLYTGGEDYGDLQGS